ncbi:MAG: DUF2804 domain-containing protein [Clostridia bacterium]|nr:DUF2804 domain-containing protein [Clostridia bacterium]
MANELKRTYVPFNEWTQKSKQTEYTEETPLLSPEGKLLAKGWARRNVFTYNRDYVKTGITSRKEWDFYTIHVGNEMQVLVSFANINLGGYVGAKLVNLKTGEVICDSIQFFLGANKHVPPVKGDVPNRYKDKIGKVEFDFDTRETERRLWYKGTFKGKPVEVNVTMEIPEGLENITTIFPFEGDDTKYFMTTKQMCMPSEGKFVYGDYVYEFTKENAFCAMDWGRVNTPREMVWYWGSGNQFITDENGEKHLFGFEITWAIGDESNATETCIFYDGKVHKFGAVDVEKFPKGRFMEDWKFVSEDGRFNMTMKPTLDNHSDIDFKIGRMNCHQVFGVWNGDVTLDDGKKIEIKDLFTFCEYVENRW